MASLQQHAPRPVGAADLLTVWESGARLHALQRSALLCAWARPELSSQQVAELPLGAVTTTLLRLHVASFGAALHCCVDCARCRQRLELQLDADVLLQALPAPAGACEPAAAGLRLRPVTLGDLAAVAGVADAAAAARELLARCAGVPVERITRLEPAQWDSAEQALEGADPAADLTFEVHCPACGGDGGAQLDPGVLLWAQVERAARGLLQQIHTLAGAYGWSERDILALSAERRAVYLEWAAA